MLLHILENKMTDITELSPRNRGDISFEDTTFTCIPDEISFEGSNVHEPSRIWKCPLCKRPYTTKAGLYDHIYLSHKDELPEGMSPAQFTFNLRNKKAFGLCRECKVNKTEWNEDAERYNMFCGEECKQKYATEAKRRMVEKYGKTHILDDPKHQQKMMDSRSISGKYRFSKDGIEVPYMGSYEYDFLRHLDMVFGFGGSEVIRCPHTFEYEYEDKKLVYIPDYYLPNFNLIVEIKDGGDNPNMHHKIQGVDKVKEAEKDSKMKSQTEFNYVKVINKTYTLFVYLMKMIINSAWDDPEFKNKYDNLVLIPTE